MKLCLINLVIKGHWNKLPIWKATFFNFIKVCTPPPSMKNQEMCAPLLFLPTYYWKFGNVCTPFYSYPPSILTPLSLLYSGFQGTSSYFIVTPLPVSILTCHKSIQWIKQFIIFMLKCFLIFYLIVFIRFGWKMLSSVRCVIWCVTPSVWWTVSSRLSAQGQSQLQTLLTTISISIIIYFFLCFWS